MNVEAHTPIKINVKIDTTTNYDEMLKKKTSSFHFDKLIMLSKKIMCMRCRSSYFMYAVWRINECNKMASIPLA